MTNIVDSPLCIWGGIEMSEHFSSNVTIMMLIGLHYLINAILSFGNIDLEKFLFDESNPLHRDNEIIFLEVQILLGRITDCATIFIHC